MRKIQIKSRVLTHSLTLRDRITLQRLLSILLQLEGGNSTTAKKKISRKLLTLFIRKKISEMKHVFVPGRRLLRARFAHTCSSQRSSSSTPRTISPNRSIQTQIKYFARRIKQPASIFHHRTHAISATAAAPKEQDLVCSIKVTILDVPGSLAEDLSDMLLAECATSASVEEYRPSGAPEEKIFANDPSSDKRVWDRCSVIGYFPAEMDADAAASTAASSLNLSSCRRTVEEIRQQDWVRFRCKILFFSFIFLILQLSMRTCCAGSSNQRQLPTNSNRISVLDCSHLG